MYCPFGREVELIAGESMGPDYCREHCGHDMNAYDHNIQNCKCVSFLKEAERRRYEDSSAGYKKLNS